MAGQPIRGALMRYFEQHPGTHVYLADIAKDIGEDERRVQQNISTLTRDLNYPVQTVVRGQVYVYRPPSTDGDGADAKAKPRAKPKSELMFVYVGPARDGAMILECEDGRFFKAVEL